MAAVKPLRVQDQALAKTVVENSEAGANDGFGRGVLFAAQTPGKTHARREVPMVLDSGLRFKAQTIAERHVRTKSPIVFGVETGIHKSVLNQRISHDHAELAGLPCLEILEGVGCLLLSDGVDGGGKRERPVEILSGRGGVRGGAQPPAEANEMLTQVQRSVVLELEVIGDDVAHALWVATFGKRAQHGDGRR